MWRPDHYLSAMPYFFSAGTGHLCVGDDVRAGGCVVIPPGAVHKLTNTGDEPLTPLCRCAPADSNDDTVLTGG
jgi:mannose-6-phosphate isomerase-like protein (cupin superfamily)